MLNEWRGGAEGAPESAGLTAAEVAAYLDRIGFAGPLRADAATLAALQRTHLLTVPFENLDIHPPRRKIVLEIGWLFAKVVAERRGGFCYELNGLFAALLRALSFEVDLLSARVRNDGGGFGPEFDHLTLLVHLDDRPMLADVGFGESFQEPLQLISEAVQEQPNGAYRLLTKGAEWSYQTRLDDGAWLTEYVFTLTPRRLGEFAAMCRHHQTSPESSFTRGRLYSLATPEGRITLRDDRLIVTRDGRREETPLAGDADFHAALARRFGIVLPR